MNWNEARKELKNVKRRYRQAMREWRKNNGAHIQPSMRTRETFAINALSKTPDDFAHGVEALKPTRRNGSLLLYANTGETYALTILAFVGYDRTLFKIGNWGDLVESGRYKGYA